MLLKRSAFDVAPAGGLLIAMLMIELIQSRVCGMGVNVFTFAFDMLITLHMAVSHSLHNKCYLWSTEGKSKSQGYLL